jgi:hypothetical protein
VKTTIPLNAPPVSLAFDPAGVLYALESPAFGSNQATLRTILPDGTFGASYPVSGAVEGQFFAGGMIYDGFDPLNPRLLISDNAGNGYLYAFDFSGEPQILLSPVAGIADVAVRGTGEIFVSTAPFGQAGEVFQVDRVTGATTPVLSGLGFGAGLEFDATGDLIVQDVNTDTFAGRLQRLPVTEMPGGLEFGDAAPLIGGMQSGYGLAIDSEGDIFTTGRGGLFEVSGMPLAEVSFDTNGNEFQFAAAIAFGPGSLPFEGFTGPGGGRLAYTADGFIDTFITLLTPAPPGDYNSDGSVDALDYVRWQGLFGSAEAAADGNGDKAVDAADYVIWRKLVLSGGDGGGSAALTSQVPEPTTAAFVTGILIASLLILRHRQFL